MQLKNWLDNPLKNYNVGIQLMEQFNAPSYLINTCKLLTNTETGFNKIITYLTKIDKEKNEEIVSKIEKIDATYVQLQDAWKSKYKEANYKFQNELEENCSLEIRKNAALFILETFKNIIEPLWREVDHYKNTGNLPTDNYFVRKEIAEKPPTIIELIKKRNSIRTLISKYKKNPKKTEIIKELQVKIVELEEKINAF